MNWWTVMGTHIEAVWAQGGNGLRRATARALADAAARNCLALAGRAPGDIDMLINVGMYREDSMGEPALAALIQQDIGASASRRPAGHAGQAGQAGTFSFDLLNGACGALTAIQIESGLLKSGVIGLGAVVSSDVQPDVKDPGAAFLRPAGGALLLRWRDGDAGFTDFATETFPEYQDLFTSGLVWRRRHGIPAPRQGAGRNEMIVTMEPGYHARLADCAEEATRRFLRRLGLGVTDIDLLVPAPAHQDFVDRLRVHLHIPGDRVAYTPEDLAGAYTTGPLAALQAAVKSGRLAEARTTLLLAAGPGATIALALYRQPDGEPE
jgi:3-oxoacyl-[acyl-carrier-protein] synthase-3